MAQLSNFQLSLMNPVLHVSSVSSSSVPYRLDVFILFADGRSQDGTALG